MIDFSDIDAFIDSTKEVYILPPEVESEINEYMEELEQELLLNEGEAIINARKLIIL